MAAAVIRAPLQLTPHGEKIFTTRRLINRVDLTAVRAAEPSVTETRPIRAESVQSAVARAHSFEWACAILTREAVQHCLDEYYAALADPVAAQPLRPALKVRGATFASRELRTGCESNERLAPWTEEMEGEKKG